MIANGLLLFPFSRVAGGSWHLWLSLYPRHRSSVRMEQQKNKSYGELSILVSMANQNPAKQETRTKKKLHPWRPQIDPSPWLRGTPPTRARRRRGAAPTSPAGPPGRAPLPRKERSNQAPTNYLYSKTRPNTPNTRGHQLCTGSRSELDGSGNHLTNQLIDVPQNNMSNFLSQLYFVLLTD